MSRRNTLRDLSAPPTMRKVKRGDAFLPGVDVSEIESLQAKNTNYKIKCILQAVLLRKAGRTLRNISKAIGFSKSTIYGWLERLAAGGLKRIRDNKSPGRSCRLSVKQQNRLKRDLGKNPDKSGFLRGSWTAKIVVCHIKNKFKVAYGASGALRLTKKLGFSVRCARPVPYNCATPEKQDEYVCETIKMLKKYDSEHYKVVCVDAAAFVDAPSSMRGIRVKGGKDTVTINFSKKSIKIIGALGQDTFDMQFHQISDGCRQRNRTFGVSQIQVWKGICDTGQRRSPHRQTDGRIHQKHQRRCRLVVSASAYPATQSHRGTMARDKACSCRPIFWRVGRAAKEDQAAVAQWGGAHSQTVWIHARCPQKSKRAMVPSADHTYRPCNHTAIICTYKTPVH